MFSKGHGRFFATDRDKVATVDLSLDLVALRFEEGLYRRVEELWPRVGDGLREGGGVSWGVTKPPGLQARSDTP